MTRRPSGRSNKTAAARSKAARPVKRSLAINGHATSISLEGAFWEALKEAATAQGLSMVQLVARIDAGRGEAGLSSAVRVWLLEHSSTRSRADPPGTTKA